MAGLVGLRSANPTYSLTDRASPASMRPRPQGLGDTPSKFGSKYSEGIASMRPRPQGLGDTITLAQDFLTLNASMRPRPQGLGDTPCQEDLIGGAVASMRPRPTAWEIGRTLSTGLLLYDASMRPKLGGLGDSETAPVSSFLCSCQRAEKFASNAHTDGRAGAKFL